MNPKSYILKDLLWLTLVISILFGAFLGSRALMVPDEGRYAEIPREMVRNNDYLTPHLANLKYFEKPPLYYWITALPIKFIGLNTWSLRLPTAFIGLIGCLFVYFLGLALYNRRTGILSALVLSSSTLYYTMSHLLTPDLPLTVFLTIALGCFILGTREPLGNKRLYYFLGMYAFAGLATLTKGLVGFILPGLVIFMWILCLNEWRSLRSYYLFRGTLLFLLIVAPWHIMMQLEHPEFFHYYFMEQHVLRYLTDYADRAKPAWFLISVVIIGLFPWCWILLTALCAQVKTYFSFWHERKIHKASIFLVLWPLLIFLFFSVSSSLLLAYALPIIPPLAILTARYIDLSWDHKHTAVFTIAFVGIAMTALAMSIIGFINVVPTETLLRSEHYWYLSLLLLSISTLIAFNLYWRKGLKTGFIALFLGTSITLISINLSYETIDPRSIKPLAVQLHPLLTPDTLVITYKDYYQDLPVYLDRSTQLVDYRGELGFGIDHQQSQSIIWDPDMAWKYWQENSRTFMIMSLQDYKHLIQHTKMLPLYPLGQTSKHILLTNRPL